MHLELAIAERWAAEFSLSNGATTYATVRPTVTALSPSRYYEPTATNRVRGVNKCSTLGTNQPATSLASRIAFDSASSPFRNCKREVSFGNVAVNSASRSTTQYSTPYGTETQAARSATSNVKQYVAAVNTATLASGGIDLEAVLFGRELDACVASVHIPN